MEAGFVNVSVHFVVSILSDENHDRSQENKE
jgi:hypothetical protein